MNNSLKKLRSFSLGLLGVAALAGSAQAQLYQVDIDKPKFDDLPSPTFGGLAKDKNFKPKDWLEVELKLKVSIEQKFRNRKFADRLTVKWYIALDVMEDNGKSRTRFMEKEVKYVNVPLEEDIYVSVYLSPSAIMRISGRDNAKKGIVRAVAGQVRIDGVEPRQRDKGFFTTDPSKGFFWNEIPPYNSIPLLNKNQTPFKALWWDRYAEIEEED